MRYTRHDMHNQKIYVYGKHAVSEALHFAPHSVERVLLSPDSTDEDLRALAAKAGAQAGKLLPKTLPREIEAEAVHQGIVALVSLEKLMVPYDEFVQSLAITPNTSLILLGELQDPQNVGAIIRSAAGFGVSGVLVPEHNQAPITGSVVKVSAGMAFKVPLVQIGNVNSIVRDLKERGFWIYGLEADAKNPLSQERFDAPAVFILGGEAKGIRQKTLELCDIALSVPIHPRCESLNVAASASALLYAWSAQHPRALLEA